MRESRVPGLLVAYLLDPFTESSLPAIILARDPYRKKGRRHRSCEVSLPGSLLALGENSAVLHLPGLTSIIEQSGADTLPARYVFTGCKHQGAWRARGAWVPGVVQAAPPLLVAAGACGNSRSATLFSSRSPCNAAGAKSSTTSKASFAWNANDSKAFAVEAKLAGSRVASMAAPKCCWHNAARALLNKPLEPLQVKSAPNEKEYRLFCRFAATLPLPTTLAGKRNVIVPVGLQMCCRPLGQKTKRERQPDKPPEVVGGVH